MFSGVRKEKWLNYCCQRADGAEVVLLAVLLVLLTAQFAQNGGTNRFAVAWF